MAYKKQTLKKYEPPAGPPAGPPADEKEEDLMTPDEAFAKAVDALVKTKDVQLLTDLNEEEIRKIASLWTVFEMYKIDIGKKALINFMKLRVSTRRKGRGEVLQVAKSAREDEKERSKLRQLLSFGGRM